MARNHLKEEIDLLNFQKIPGSAPQPGVTRPIDAPRRKRDADPYRDAKITKYLSRAVAGVAVFIASSAAYLHWAKTHNVG